MIGKGTRWKAKKERGGLFAYTILDNTAEDILRSRPSSTAVFLSEQPVAEIPYHAGDPKARAEIARLIERAPLMREALLREAQYLKEIGTLVSASPSQMREYLAGIADRMKDAAGGRA